VFSFFRQRNPTSSPENLQVTARTGADDLQVTARTDAETRTAPDPSNDPWAWAEGLIAPPTIAGPEVSPVTALECAPVRNAVDILAGLMGTLPVGVYKPRAGGGTEAVDSHPAVPFVRDDANPWTSAGELRTALTVDALLWGAGYGLVLRDSDGKPVEIHRIQPWCVVVTPDPFTQEPVFTVSPNAQTTAEYTCRDIIYIRPIVKIDNLATSGFQVGLAPIKTGRQAIGLALAMERHAAQIMGQGGRPSGVLKFPSKLGATANESFLAGRDRGPRGRGNRDH
jgi:HK97 family phage portal protein